MRDPQLIIDAGERILMAFEGSLRLHGAHSKVDQILRRVGDTACSYMSAEISG